MKNNQVKPKPSTTTASTKADKLRKNGMVVGFGNKLSKTKQPKKK